MSIRITLADLTYTDQGYPSVSFPFGAALIASYAKKILGDKIECELFKYPEDFKNYVEKKKPKIICFSNYSWTFDLSYQFSKKIKKKISRYNSYFWWPQLS